MEYERALLSMQQHPLVFHPLKTFAGRVKLMSGQSRRLHVDNLPLTNY
jgi:hypothetical protein